jgi:hypothetical protein
MATATSSSPTSITAQNHPVVTTRLFLLVLVLLISGAILRSAIATRLDSFTMDETYHIVAGVSYVQRGDFRINPEHPPLVKLWVGSIISAMGFHLSPFREIHDKPDEREFVNDDTYLHNDPVALQHHARIAMWTFNGSLMVAFAFALRRVFGPLVALGAVLFLAIDPTVAAHLPVVMTDLPIALLSATAVVLAGRAFRNWLWPDLVGCSVVRYWMGMEKLFAQKPDLAEAERFFRQSADLDPSAFWTFIQLGNIYLSRGSLEKAVSAYESARDHAPAGSVFRRSIEDQLRLISTNPLSQVPALRDPSQE